MNKQLLILKNSNLILESAIIEENGKKEYILEGVFGEIGVKNKNNRIYDENEYVPHVEKMSKRIEEGQRILGELDHPPKFETSLKNVSHVIEKIWYEKDSKLVKGRIKLLDTDMGKQAKALVDAGIPLQISSRAAGSVNTNSHVKIQELFTYDLVADPGFANATLESVNESYGFPLNEGFQVFEMGESTEIYNTEQKQTETMLNENNEKQFVEVSDFENYSKYLLETINKKIAESKSDNSELETIKTELSEAKETIAKLIKHNNYLAENLDNVIKHSDQVVEGVNNLERYSEYLAENLDKTISYGEYLAENLDNSIAYGEYLAENLSKSIDYSEYLAENVDKSIEFSNYLAENLDGSISEQEVVKQFANYLAGKLEEGIAYSEYIAESVSKELENSINESVEENTEEVLNESVEVKEENSFDKFANAINEQLSQIVNKAKEEKDPSFFAFINESTQEKYSQLPTEQKEAVSRMINENVITSQSGIQNIIDSVYLNVDGNVEPQWLKEAPKMYKEKWENLSESKKSEITKQAGNYSLTTPYQINHFWNTRKLNEGSKSEFISEDSLNESKEVNESVQTNEFDDIAARLRREFGL